jgi:hypothetical protein
MRIVHSQMARVCASDRQRARKYSAFRSGKCHYRIIYLIIHAGTPISIPLAQSTAFYQLGEPISISAPLDRCRTVADFVKFS